MGNKFLFRTNKNAPNYKIIAIDFNNPDESKWVDLIPEHPKDVLEWGRIINHNMIVICYLKDVKVRYNTKLQCNMISNSYSIFFGICGGFGLMNSGIYPKCFLMNKSLDAMLT